MVVETTDTVTGDELAELGERLGQLQDQQDRIDAKAAQAEGMLRGITATLRLLVGRGNLNAA